jgi:hypothetical protein
MKAVKFTHLTIIACFLLLTACLERDNPLDGNNNTNMQNGVALKFNSYTVHSDDNGDRIVNPGERIQIKVSLRNAGNRDATTVRARFSTTSPHISNLTPTSLISYGNIPARGVRWAQHNGSNSANEGSITYTIQFDVSNTAPAGTQVPIVIDMSDGSGISWIDTFYIPVLATNARVIYNSNSIHSDNNGDRIINKGERIQMKISLRNAGSSTAVGVRARFSTTSPFISGLTPTSLISYGDITANGVRWAQHNGSNSTNEGSITYSIQFDVSNTTPAGTQIPIVVDISDRNGNTWTDTFNITVEATRARIIYNSNSIHSDNNGDRIINKGERIQMKVSLRNTGLSSAINVRARFSTTSPFISGLTPTSLISYGSIPANGVRWAQHNGSNSTNEGSITYTIQFDVSNTTPAGTQIPFAIDIVDESNNIWTDTLIATVEATRANIIFNSYSIHTNSGTLRRVRVSLRNSGLSSAIGVRAAFSTTSPHVTGLTPTSQITYGTIPANGVRWAQHNGSNSTNEGSITYTIEYNVSASAPAGTQIPFTINIVDESNNTWTANFSVPR